MRSRVVRVSGSRGAAAATDLPICACPSRTASALAETFIRLGGFSVIMTRLQHVENQPMTVHQLTRLLSLLAATRCFVRQPLGLDFFRVSCSAAKQVIDAMTDEELRNTE